MHQKRWKALLLGAVSALALAVAGCSGGGDSGTDTGSGNGTLRVHMSDGLDPNVKALNVTITKVQANINEQWQDVPVQRTTLNVMDLADNDIVLAQGSVPAGHYGQVRVFVTDAKVTLKDGSVQNVTIPSGDQTGVKLNINYDINPNQITALLLDFNVDKSLTRTGSGKYMLHPVIPVVVKVLSGTISGTVNLAAGGPADQTFVKAIYTAGSNYALNTEVNTSSTQADGTFKIWALLPGVYRLEFSRTVDGVTTMASKEDVVVTADHDTAIGTVTLG